MLFFNIIPLFTRLFHVNGFIMPKMVLKIPKLVKNYQVLHFCNHWRTVQIFLALKAYIYVESYTNELDDISDIEFSDHKLRLKMPKLVKK